jgi:hypothetical protein
MVAVEGAEHTFYISIISIEEKNSTGLVRPPINMSNVNFTLIPSTNSTIYNFSTVLENKAVFNVIVSILLYSQRKKKRRDRWKIWDIEQPTKINFGGETTTYQNTVRLSINVQNWPFMALQNSLEIVIDGGMVGNDTSEELACINSNIGQNNNLRWVVVVVNTVSLYPFVVALVFFGSVLFFYFLKKVKK